MGAAVTLLLSASALGAGVLTTEQVAIGGAGAQQNPAIAIDPDAPLNAAVVAEDLSGGGLFPRTVTASVARLVGRGLARCDASAPRAVALRRSAGPRVGRRRLRLRFGPRPRFRGRLSGRGSQHEQQHLHARQRRRLLLLLRRWRRALGHVAAGHDRRGEDRDDRAGDRGRPQHPRPRLHRVFEAHLRGCQLHRQPAGLRDLPDLLHERRGLVVPAQARVAHLPFRHRSLP